MATPGEVRSRVRSRLDEQTAAVWADGELDEAIIATLDEYNFLFPMEAAASLVIGDGAMSLAAPAGTRDVVRVTLESGAVLPRRLQPVGSAAGEQSSWELFAGTLYFSQPMAGQTLSVWYLGSHAIEDVPEPDTVLLVLGAVWRALQQREVQQMKRGGPPPGVSHGFIIRRAGEEYRDALDRRRRRLRARTVTP